MTLFSESRMTKLVSVVALLLISVAGLTAGLVHLSTPGYADEKAGNPILHALLEETPTPVPTPVGAACGVHMAESVTIATDTAAVELSNAGADATLQAITAVWPEDNGELHEIMLGGRSIWSGIEGSNSTTIFPDTTKILPIIKTGEQTSLTLRFSERAISGRYILILHLGKSCYALFDSNQTFSSEKYCFITFDQFSVDEQESRLLIRNTTEEPISLRRFLVFWPNEQAALNSVKLDDGESLISAPAEKSPVEIQLPTDSSTILQPSQSAKLDLRFNAVAPLANYTIAVLTDECQSVFANTVRPSACPVRSGDGLEVVGNAAGLVLENLGRTNQPIEGVWLTFPDANDALIDVILNDTSVVNQSSDYFPQTSSPATMTTGVQLQPNITLPPNRRSALAFLFEAEDVASQHYTVELDLSNECRVLATTRTQQDPGPCEVEIVDDQPIQTESDKLRLRFRNTGEVPAELHALQVDWAAQFNGALTAVTLGDAPFWEGERKEGTATVAHNTDAIIPVLEPGATMVLELTFANEVVTGPYVLRMNFAEGCQLTYATQDDLTMPAPIQVGGVIDELPSNAFDGIWRIRWSTDRILSVQVTPQTLIQPEGLTPVIGDFVSARLLPLGEDRYLATQVLVRPNLAQRIVLRGLIEEVGAQSESEHIIVQGIRVEITEDTLVQGTLGVGWFAHVEGWKRADETILAESISTTEPQQRRRRVDIEGLLEAWDQLSSVETVWTVSQLRVIVNENTTIHHGIEPGQEPELDVMVRVTGDMVTANTIEAVELWYGPGAEIEEFTGVIRALPEASDAVVPTGNWIIEDSSIGTCTVDEDPDAQACKEVFVDGSTFVDTSRATPDVGAPVDVIAQRNPDGNLIALRIVVLLEENAQDDD